MLALFDQGPSSPCPKSFNMAAHVLEFASPDPEKIALSVLGVHGSKHWTYHALTSLVRRTAQGFLDQGLVAGDKILIRLGNTVDFPVVYLAALAVDMIPIPTSPMLTTPEVDKIVLELCPKAVVIADSVAGPTSQDHITITPKDIELYQNNKPASFVFGDPNRVGYIVYTSGTSGQPRAVVHAHRAIWARQMMIKNWYDLTENDRVLHAGAFNWTFTLGTGLMDPWSMGATAMIADPSVQIKDLPLLLAQHDATLFAAAPGVYRKLLQNPALLSLPKLRHGLSAGEKLAPRIAEHWKTVTRTQIYEAFGMSECSTFVSGSPSAPVPLGALGRVQPGRRVAILPQDGTDAPVDINTPGVIAVHQSDPGLMLGYFNQASETKAKFRGEWFLTGDIGQMDETGIVTYLGRTDDMMNAGGFRVSPLEVEATLGMHPDIDAVAVAEINVKQDTTIICAFYVAKTEIPKETLIAFASANLARYKQPRDYIHVDALPSGANGKLARKNLCTLLGDRLG